MFEIKGKSIRLTRGDSAVVTVEIVRELADGTREPYTVEEGDTLVFSARRTCAPFPSLQIVSRGSSAIVFMPSHTASMAAEEYVYDVQLTTAAGDVYTVIDDGRLTLTRGVTV